MGQSVWAAPSARVSVGRGLVTGWVVDHDHPSSPRTIHVNPRKLNKMPSEIHHAREPALGLVVGSSRTPRYSKNFRTPATVPHPPWPR